MNLKRTMLAALVAAVLIPGGLWARGKTGNARIKVDIERQKGEIDRNIYGNFVEHLGRCIYDNTLRQKVVKSIDAIKTK